MRLLLIRHARQNSPLCNVDVPLSDIGIRQAKLLSRRLQGISPDVVYTSNLLRAKQTAGILFGAVYPFFERAELDEISFGDLTGKSDRDNYESYAAYYEAKRRKEENLRIPGGENPTEVYERAHVVVEEVLNAHVDMAVFVTHGGVIRALTAGLLGIGAEKMLRISERLENTSITELSYTAESGCFSLESLNDYGHLLGDAELLRSAWYR